MGFSQNIPFCSAKEVEADALWHALLVAIDYQSFWLHIEFDSATLNFALLHDNVSDLSILICICRSLISRFCFYNMHVIYREEIHPTGGCASEVRDPEIELYSSKLNHEVRDAADPRTAIL